MLGLVVALCSCGEVDRSAPPPSSTSTTNVAVTPGRAEEPGATVGATYAYELSTHCGIEWADIDGALWRTAPLDDGHGNPPPGWDNPRQAGWLTITAVDTAEFAGSNRQRLTFRRTDGSVQPPGCA